VRSVEIGAKRRLASVAIDIDGDDAVAFDLPARLSRENVQALCLQTGFWAGLVQRPFGRIPDPGHVPDAIFVTAMHTDPLAADAIVELTEARVPLARGLGALRLLTDGPVFVCQGPGPDCVQSDRQVRVARFSGPHPAGLPGTHIDRLRPVTGGRTIWQTDAQDVIALGRLLETGEMPGTRIIALAGPGVRDPALMRVPNGASLDDLARGQLVPGQMRVLSGSPLSGRESACLRRHHWQVSVLPRVDAPMRGDGWLPRHSKPLRPAPMVPTMALTASLGPDLPVIPLIRALACGDVEMAEKLGVLGLLEDDLALAAYASGGQDLPGMLRQVLDALEDRA
jgi:Na+-transporting NADH:ubiquinone oxidoreductase subunit A